MLIIHLTHLLALPRPAISLEARSWPSPRWVTQLHLSYRADRGSVPDLIASIESYLAAHNDDPKPYMWTATAESILTKVQRASHTRPTGQLKLRRTTS